jgi:hypothetical protein
LETFLLDYLWGKTGANIKWVDDEHALAVFPSAEAAQTLLESAQRDYKVRPYAKASRAALHIAPEGKKKEYGWLHGFRNKGLGQGTAAGSACVQLRSRAGSACACVLYYPAACTQQGIILSATACLVPNAFIHKQTVCPAGLVPPRAARPKINAASACCLISNALSNSQVQE